MIHRGPGGDGFEMGDSTLETAEAGVTVHARAVVGRRSGVDWFTTPDRPTGTVDFTFYTESDSCSGASVPSGTVDLQDHGGPGLADVDGFATAHPSSSQGPLKAGKYSFRARYNGSEQFGPAIGPCVGLTVTPAATPTTTPTATPTAAPTATPTAVRTVTPTVVPTTVATAVPTATPTVEPTAVATAEPTAIPTAVPTPTPTVTPAPTPTAVPTATPTPMPSDDSPPEEPSPPPPPD